MILKRTVLVLGAGASVPYGFPTGSQLARAVYGAVSSGSAESSFSLALAERGYSRPEALQHMKEFEESDCVSLDEFANTRPDVQDFVKAAIVCYLYPLERPESLFPDFRAVVVDNKKNWIDVDWCRYLFRKMKTPRAEDFKDNQLRVITFNFDRSFEHRMVLAMRATYRLDWPQVSDLCSAFPVLHLHGSLGRHPIFGGSNSSVERPYEPNSLGPIRSTLIDEIKIVEGHGRDDISTEVLKAARDHLEWAEHVWFLGFGFHPVNMARLRLNEHLRFAHLRGTALGFTEAELVPVRKFCGANSIGLHREWDALTFLRNDAEVLNC